MSTFKSISTEQELDARIHNFLERKTKRFPELDRVDAEQERTGLLVKFQSSMPDWIHPAPRRAH